MATRNLSRAFFELRQSSKAPGRKDNANADDDGSLLEKDSNASNFKTMKESLPPLWVEKIEQAEEDISKIQSKMKELSALHTKRLMVDFESDEVEQEKRIEHETAQITNIFRHAEGILKKFGTTGSSSDKMSQAELSVRNNLQRSLAKRLQTLSMSFRTSQKEYMTKLKAQTSGVNIEIFEQKSSNDKSGLGHTDHGFNSEQLRMVDETSQMVEERDEEIVKIAKSIEELAAIFKELSAMVIDQGTVLDRIDYNMEQTLEHTKDGMQQLQKAEEHQKNSLSIKCIIFLCVLIFVMVVIMIFKHRKK